ncbi:DEAD/DEAH box helicase [Streptomyces sp. NBC_00134]|uniref:DEAD/DEAH box helicase n=1 Tax=Streptomyces sp. NBC_00134 TaxID=2975663 RepID=UPI0032430C75
MFNRGIDELLQELPRIGEFDGSDIRRMLTRAWVDIMEWRDLAPTPGVGSRERLGVPDSPFITAGWTSPRAALRRLATALEVHAVLVPGLATVTVQACAFVAAEALSICNEQPDQGVSLNSVSPLGSARRYEHLEAGLLYRIAGYDANAARCGDEIGELDTPIDAESPASEWAMGTFRELLVAQVSPDLPDAPPAPSPSEHLDARVRHALWRKMGEAARRHTQWLTHQTGAVRTAVEEIRTLISLLHPDPDGWGGQVIHPDIHHIAVLLAKALEEDETRALRAVPNPPDEDGRYASYVQEQAKSRPLLWPSARIYAEQALPGPHAHAVVCVPTGAGKSAVAELAIAQTLHRGWVLYLAPTNALVGQLVRRLSSVFESLPGVQVRGFLGGAEYALLESEDLAVIGSCQVLVMTPEKCSLALRQNPDAFEDLQLCILDEAHLIEEPNGRGALTELVIAEVLHRAPHVRALLMSALIANADELADWLTAVTGVEAVPISHPWRPTRTLRAIAGFDQAGEEAAQALARDRLATLPGSRKKLTYDAPISLLVGLQGAWATNHPKDYWVVRTPVLSPRELHRTDGPSPTGVCLPMTAAIVTAMAEKGHRVLAFLPQNRHHSFTQAVKLSGSADWAPANHDKDIEALLTLAGAELGIESELRATLVKGVGVHTGALLREEQRASEISFDRDRIRVLFATGTLSQGLNLPATAVVIGGTKVGFDQDASPAERERRSRTQLLNAIGRAGRAYTSARSIAVVVPGRATQVANGASGKRVALTAGASFLTQEDAANDISSRLDGLIEKALGESLEVATLEGEEQSAFSFLSFAAGSGDAPGVVRRTWAVHRAGAASQGEAIAEALEATGSAFLAREQVPDWVSLAAHRAGLGLPETSYLYRWLLAELDVYEAPNTVEDWAYLLVDALASAPPEMVESLLPLTNDYRSTAIEALWSSDPDEAAEGHRALAATLIAWIQGEDLLSVAGHALGPHAERTGGRGQGMPLPKIIGLTDRGFGFRLSVLAGAMGAIVTTACETELQPGRWELPEACSRALSLLPFAVRWGAGNPGVIAWMRAGVRPRVVAHMLERRMPLTPSADWMNDEDLLRLAARHLAQTPEWVMEAMEGDRERELFRAMSCVREMT